VLTLRHWLRRLERDHAEALSFVHEATYRVWRLYLAGSAHGFRRGHIAPFTKRCSPSWIRPAKPSCLSHETIGTRKVQQCEVRHDLIYSQR
jgi:hypothetical protein